MIQLGKEEMMDFAMTDSRVLQAMKSAFSSALGLTNPRDAAEILSYSITRHSNAILEHFNLRISISKNGARGFMNMGDFNNMIYLVCGDL